MQDTSLICQSSCPSARALPKPPPRNMPRTKKYNEQSAHRLAKWTLMRHFISPFQASTVHSDQANQKGKRFLSFWPKKSLPPACESPTGRAGQLLTLLVGQKLQDPQGHRQRAAGLGGRGSFAEWPPETRRLQHLARTY